MKLYTVRRSGGGADVATGRTIVAAVNKYKRHAKRTGAVRVYVVDESGVVVWKNFE